MKRKRKLSGAAKEAFEKKLLRDGERAERLDGKRRAIEEMRYSHAIVKRLRKFDVVSHCAKQCTIIAYNAVLIALYVCPFVLLCAFTVKAFFFIVNLF